jgi:predicted ATPase/DNA-binding SARP family transcriptional activator
VEFRILGSVEAVDDGLTIDLGGLRERALLARLLLSADQIVSADRLAEDLWSGNPPPHSSATLRVYISRLRRALGPGSAALLTQPPGYRMILDPGQLDADRFEALAAAARADLAEGRAAAAAERLRQALALWRGDALSDVADLSFAQADVIRLAEARLAALEDRVEAELACGRHISLTSELEGLMASHPLRERLCGQRMLALYRCGRQADALQAFADLRTRLADELGIDPNPSLHRLQQAILRQSPELDWPPAGRPAETGGSIGAGGIAGSGSGGVAGSAAGTGGDADERPEGRPSYLAERPGSWLPAETTSFIGRAAELATISELLGLSRLLTLTGPGGSGKTRLALRAAALAAASYPGGVALVELASVAGSDLVCAVAASAVSVREEPGRPLIDSIVACLRDSEALLVVDNCEHVIDAAAELIAVLLRNCPSLRILATSQSRLGLAGEASWPVPPLILPDRSARDLRCVAEAESVALFCDRAALARPGFRLTAENVAAVSEICRRLDGIPLALELAAARLNALSAGQIAARIDNRFALLAGAGRGGLPRHRTLQAALEWSHDLLSEAEQVCFRRLAVFSGGCTLEAAEAVCPDPGPSEGVRTAGGPRDGGSRDGGPRDGGWRDGERQEGGPRDGERQEGGLPAELVLQTVSALVDRSLLTTEERCGSMRYGMLESVHQFARVQLARAGESGELSRRHLDWLLGYAREADLDGPDQGAWLELLEADLENFRAALAWSLDRAGTPAEGPAGMPAEAPAGWAARAPAEGPAGMPAEGPAGMPAEAPAGWAASASGGAAGSASSVTESALEIAGALAPFWMVRGHIGLGRGWLDSALAAAGPAADRRLRAIALDGAGQLAYVQADHDAQRGYQEESLVIWRSLGQDARVASCLGDLGAVAHVRGEYPAALAMYTEALELARAADDSQRMARALSGLGRLALHQDDLAAATRYYTASMERFRQIGDLRRATLILGNLGVVAINQGDTDLARTRLEEHLGNARRIGDLKLIGGALTNLGLVVYNAGDLDRAAELHDEALRSAERVGDRRLAAVALTNLGLVALARKDLQAARSFHCRSLALAEQVGELRSIAESLEEIAGVDAASGAAERAAVLFGAAQALRGQIGSPIPAPDLARFDAAVSSVRLALGERGFSAAQARGRQLSPAQAATLARQPADAPAWPSHGSKGGRATSTREEP